MTRYDFLGILIAVSTISWLIWRQWYWRRNQRSSSEQSADFYREMADALREENRKDVYPDRDSTSPD
jgi:hypothetical protein